MSWPAILIVLAFVGVNGYLLVRMLRAAFAIRPRNRYVEREVLPSPHPSTLSPRSFADT